MIEDLGREEAENLWLGALAGVPELAVEIERIELCEPDQVLMAARGLRPVLLRYGPEAVETLPRVVDREDHDG